MHITVALSYFHRKMGPMVYYYYPQDSLRESEKIRIADFMDSAFEEGFFSHTFDNLISMNYYFEIFSEYARGMKEMLMISVVFDESVPSDVEYEVLAQCIDFAKKLRDHQHIFKAFYTEEDLQYYQRDPDNVKKYSELIKVWIDEFYWSIIELAREKTEEEIIAILMSKPSVYDTIKYLSSGPIAREDLQTWFKSKFDNISLDDILKTLEKERFVFINNIGVENYVLLVKDVSVFRIPPDCIVTLFEEKPELSNLMSIFIERVQTYFSDYETSIEDTINLFSLVADPKIYNILSQLRQGPLSKTNLSIMYSKDQLSQFHNNLDLLKEKSIIEEFDQDGKPIILLLTDIRFVTQFPRYLAVLIPKETKGQIAKSYQPKRNIESPIENIGLESEEDTDIGLGDLDDQSLKSLTDITTTITSTKFSGKTNIPNPEPVKARSTVIKKDARKIKKNSGGE
jgi:uncharacterized protein (DUF2132 family)